MPYKNVRRYSRSPAVLAHNNGNFFTESIALTNSNVPLDDNDERTVPSGAIISKVNGSYRFLPRVKTTQATSTGSSVINVTNPFALAVNDTLEVVLPYEGITVSTAAGSDSESITVTLNNDISVLVDITSTEVSDKGKTADLIASTINNHLQASQIVNAVSDGTDTVWVMQNNIFERASISVSTSGANIAVSLANGGSIQLNNTAIGTVSSIDRVNGKVTLDSNAAFVVPADIPIGIRNAEIHGIIVEDYDMTIATTRHFAPCTHSMGVYKNRLPYFDPDVDYQLKNIVFGTKF